jgi:hypothetical protein
MDERKRVDFDVIREELRGRCFTVSAANKQTAMSIGISLPHHPAALWSVATGEGYI